VLRDEQQPVPLTEGADPQRARDGGASAGMKSAELAVAVLKCPSENAEVGLAPSD
jgi:hypothetical protein